MNPINKEISKQLVTEAVGKCLPRVKFAVAYGSAVFQQANVTQQSKRMIDLLLVVKSRHEFHLQNMQLNKTHYSGLSSWFGPRYIEWLNNWLFPIHFNSHIELDGYHVKYGVVDYETYLSDLTSWKLLTTAGRLHKPVWFLKFWEKLENTVLEENLAKCVTCALLLIKLPVIEEQELYTRITEMSYLGDIRFSVRLQNRNKVKNIVEGNRVSFQQLYRPILEKYFPENVVCRDGNIYIDFNREFTAKLLDSLPEGLKLQMVGSQGLQQFGQTFMLKSDQEVKYQLGRALSSINRRSSFRMACYHLLSSSWLKNLIYTLEKRIKARVK